MSLTKRTPKVEFFQSKHKKNSFLHERCQGTVQSGSQRWRDYNGEGYECRMLAMFLVDGKRYCERHAGRKCIELLMGRKLRS